MIILWIMFSRYGTILINTISPEILCMNSMVLNIFVTTNNTAIKSAINSIRRLTNEKVFEEIDMLLVPVLNHFHYYLYVISLAKNKGYVIDRFNMDKFVKAARLWLLSSYSRNWIIKYQNLKPTYQKHPASKISK